MDAFPISHRGAVGGAAVAVQAGNLTDGVGVVIAFHAHDSGDGFFVLCAADHTLGGIFFLSGNDGISHGAAAGVPAPAAVGAGQQVGDFPDTGIFFNSKFLAGRSQYQAEYTAQYGDQDRSSCNHDFQLLTQWMPLIPIMEMDMQLAVIKAIGRFRRHLGRAFSSRRSRMQENSRMAMV